MNLCHKCNCMVVTWPVARPGPVFLSLALSKLRLCSANHMAGYFSNLACDWLSIVWAFSEQETENGPSCTTRQPTNMPYWIVWPCMIGYVNMYNLLQSHVTWNCRSRVLTTNDLAATKFAHAITHHFEDQCFSNLSSILWSYIGCNIVISLVWLGFKRKDETWKCINLWWCG